MSQVSFKPFRGRTVRVTNLDDCCTPPASGTDCALAVFDAFTTVSLEAEVEDGDEALEKKANGDICISEKDPDALKWLNLSLTLCQVQPEVISMLTGWPVVRDANDVGIGFDITEGISTASTALEVWSGVAGIDCGQGARYGYNLIPCINGWQLDDKIEWADIGTIFSITLSATTNGTHAWSTGPYDVQNTAAGAPGPLLDPVQTGVHARIMTSEIPPPALTDGCVPATAANGYLYPPA